MSFEELPEIDPTVVAELDRMGQAVAEPAVERNFGDDTDAEFKASTEVLIPEVSRLLPGETAVQAHRRIQDLNTGNA